MLIQLSSTLALSVLALPPTLALQYALVLMDSNRLDPCVLYKLDANLLLHPPDVTTYTSPQMHDFSQVKYHTFYSCLS